MQKLLLSIFLISNFLYGVVLMPMVQTLDHKKKRQMMFTVFNPTKEPVATTFDIQKLVDNQNNKEQREVTKKLTFYPSQFVLKPNGKKNVRVRYMANELPDIEEVYRVIAKELNIDVKDDVVDAPTNGVNAKIKMRLTYEGLLFVHKPSAKSKLKIETFERTSPTSLSLTISNSGNASSVPSVHNYNFVVTINNKEYKLTEDDLKGADIRRILAGKTNTFRFPNVKLPNGKIDSIVLEKK